MGAGNNHQANKAPQHIAPTPATFTEGSADAELWLDLVSAAIKGYCGAAWAKDKGPIQMVSSGIAARASVEVADAVFAEFKKRCKVKDSQF